MENRQRKSRKAPATIGALCLCLLMPILSTAALHSEQKGETLTVLSGANPEILCSNIDQGIDFFNTPQVNWTSEGDISLLAKDQLPLLNTLPFEGSRSLLVSTESYRTDKGASLTLPFDTARDFSSYRYLTLTLSLPDSTAHTLTLTLSGNERYRNTVEIAQSSWQTILFDLSAASDLTNVTKLELHLKSSEKKAGQAFAFAIDAVGLLTESPEHALRFLTDTYDCGGCVLTYGQTMTVKATGSSAWLRTNRLPDLSLGNETAFCVTLKNLAGFTTMSCEYTDAKTSAKKTLTRSLENNSELQYVYFPIRADKISDLFFTFEGGSSGEVILYSIAPVSFLVTQSEEIGTISSCALDATKNHLIVTGTISEKDAQASLKLMELTSGQTLADVKAGDAKVLATHPMQDQFRFEINLPSVTDTLLHSYVVAAVTQDAIFPICEPICIDNPELLASKSFTPAEAVNKKGTTLLQSTDIFDGVSYTAIPVQLEKLVTLDASQSPHKFGENTYYFRIDYLQSLDRLIEICRDRGIYASLVLTVSPSQDTALNRILLHPDADHSAPYCAFHTESDEASATFAAAVSLLSQRYGVTQTDKGGVTSLIIGQNINHSSHTYNMGNATPYAVLSSYAKALRIAYNTAKSINSALDVYASFDSVWNKDTRGEDFFWAGARYSLDLLNHIVKSQGDFDWQLAFDPYPQGEYYAFEDTGADLTSEADHVTLANLEVLSSYLARSEFYYKRQYRHILLLESSEKCIPMPEQNDNTLILNSADYVYGYYKINSPNFSRVNALIVNRDVSYHNTLRDIDTANTEQASAYALELMGLTDWSSRITAFDPASVIRRTLQEKPITTEIPSSIKGKLTLWDFKSQTGDPLWKAIDGVKSIGAGTSIGEDYYLSVQTQSGSSAWSFAAYPSQPINFTPTPYLSFELKVSGLPDSVSDLDLTIALFSGKDCLKSEMTITPGEMTRLVIDLSQFGAIQKIDSVRFLLSDESGLEVAPTLLVGKVEALSDKYEDEELRQRFEQAQLINGVQEEKHEVEPSVRTVVILSSLILLLLLAEILYVIIRRRRGRE